MTDSSPGLARQAESVTNPEPLTSSDSPSLAPPQDEEAMRQSAQPRPSMAYHLLARQWPSARWWRPLLGAVLTAVFYVALVVIAMVIGMIVALASGYSVDLEVMDMYRPVDFGVSMVLIIALLPAAFLGFRVAGAKPVGLLSSVAGRIRWAWMARCLLPAVVVFVVGVGLSQLFPGEATPGRTGSVLLVVLIVLLVPFQAAAEEYVFRGVLAQMVGAWLRHPAWAICLPVSLFVLGHAYDLPGQVSVGVFALAMGWITWRTGGLEAAIALHIVNNVLAFLAPVVLGWGDLNSTETGWAMALISAAIPVAYVLWIDRLRPSSFPEERPEVASRRVEA